MPVSKEQLAAIIGGHARELCSPKTDKILDGYAGRSGLNEGYDPDPYSFNDGGAADRFDAMLGFGTSDPSPRDFSYSQSSAGNSRMPDAIKQSMMNERIDVSKMGNTSVLDSMNIPDAPRQSRQQLREQVIPQQSVGGVDYSIIKAIVKECLDDYFSKNPINESASLKTIGLEKGNIKLVDNSGNVFEAKLQKVGNLNNKK